MAYTFQYVPPSGELSGVSFESQTAIAINELGTRTDETERSADQALDVAQNAQTTANDALLTAQNADGSADNAQLTADQALAAAGNAHTEATSALERANSAYDTAAGAMTTADTKSDAAQATADVALSAAEAAQATANMAQNTANHGLSIAQSAQTLAEKANGNFRIVSTPEYDKENLDADDYPDPDKIFFDKALRISNLPEGYADKGGYLKIYAAEDETGNSCILQTFYSTDGAAVFRREGQRVFDETEEENTTWGEWTGLPENVVTTDADGKIPPSMLPGDMVCSVSGKIDPSLLPSTVVTTGSDGRVPDNVLPGDLVRSVDGKIDPSFLPDTVPSVTTAYQVSNTAPEDTTRLWIRGTDSTAYYHNGTAWKPIVGVYAETTTP